MDGDGPVQRRHFIFSLEAARDFLIGAIFLYGYVYTAYKYGNPLLGRNDFFKYEAMVGSPFDFSATTAPFVLRQIPTVAASIFYKLGLDYDTAAVADLIGLDRDTKRRFLALILSNGLAVCLIMSFMIVAGYLRIKLSRSNMVDLFALFGVFAAWFYFPSGVVAPLTVGWGWLASSLFVIAFLERIPVLTCLACLLGMFSRETTLIFALAMVSALLLFEGERGRSLVSSVLVLIASCIAYLIVRKLFTSGYEHQISPQSIISNLTSLNFSRDFIFRSVLSQGLPAMLLLGIALKHPRYAAYLLLATGAVIVVALGAGVSETALVSGETLPFYAVIFFLTQFGVTGSRRWRGAENGRSRCRAAKPGDTGG